MNKSKFTIICIHYMYYYELMQFTARPFKLSMSTHNIAINILIYKIKTWKYSKKYCKIYIIY